MSTRTANHLITVDHLDVIATLPPGSRVVMPDVPWEEYEHLLTELNDNARFRLSYNQGRLEIMTLSPRFADGKSFSEMGTSQQTTIGKQEAQDATNKN